MNKVKTFNIKHSFTYTKKQLKTILDDARIIYFNAGWVSGAKEQSKRAEQDIRLSVQFETYVNELFNENYPIKTKPRSGNTEVRELTLYITNDGDLYRQRVQPIIKNLKRKKAKGTYNHELAKKLWGYLANDGAKKYVKEHGAPGDNYAKMFSPKDRKAVAAELADYYLEDIE